ncbi:hypothetical protein T265_07526 [Opisthorchis viverrini]|uniref:Uncharacterized protein n=1 Tax=Opisthorchis viverrini TaxID=6198 RepID=A0A074ZGV0_OPIVI|nr:hypothetical protein T265_07526 [Opisthorchis viverrini]KER24902.1 hypothetical protein T265_07526 [Opisthorchis viverrini]
MKRKGPLVKWLAKGGVSILHQCEELFSGAGDGSRLATKTTPALNPMPATLYTVRCSRNVRSKLVLDVGRVLVDSMTEKLHKLLSDDRDKSSGDNGVLSTIGGRCQSNHNCLAASTSIWRALALELQDFKSSAKVDMDLQEHLGGR